MIVAFSTSSPMVSVALIEDGRLVECGSKLAPTGASGACLELLDECLLRSERSLEEAEGFVADLGPGSFTGVKVGVTLAKTLAFSLGVGSGGAPAFDLIGEGPTAVPARRGQWLLRPIGEVPRLVGFEGILGALAYGVGVSVEHYPNARRFESLQVPLDVPERLLPSYVLPPSISEPKKSGVLP